MRKLNLEAAVWNFFSSAEFFEATAKECENLTEWFGSLAVSRGVPNFGRNNQIYDKFKKREQDFRRGAELARLGDYEFVWEISDCIRGDVRGIMEQALHSWMSDDEYHEFSDVKISRLLLFSRTITHALNNAMSGADSFLDPDPECPEQSDDDDGFPGDKIVETYEAAISWYKDPLHWDLPDPLPEYVIDKSIACKTGDEVPWTGVWYPATGLERHSLTFAIKGLRMQPVYRVLKTTEELSTDDWKYPPPQTVAVATTWHPLIPSGRAAAANEEVRAKAGEACPKAGIWQPMEPGAAQRYYAAGETMADFKSAYGITVWRWIADR
ncbi:hypothetical protein QPK32_24445 [Massilia sp. YIM B02763]|uniref:hypothetical protein n=1 Tax=Massilia sp. YIM B02763 TaxID=3050130 RepID=UPI0025B69031|nr:hypothetical protein [Massilia sp. YIM B02763]MDN4056221.1 hypothetical protein [Massilia sp. YIM B02763]